MLMKTSLYGAAAIALSFTFMPAQAQAPEAPAAAPSPTATTAPPASPFDMPPAAASDTSTDIAIQTDSAVDQSAAVNNETTLPTASEATPTPSSSAAQKPRYYDDHGNPFSKDYYEVAPVGVEIALQRDVNLPPGHFIMLLSVGMPHNSCAKILNPKYSTEFSNETMTVRVEKYAVDQRDMPQYPHYQCSTATQEPVARINLSKDLLQENQVKKVKFMTGKATQNFALKITDDFVQITPDARTPPNCNRFRPLTIEGVANPLKLWFYPENTVILSADGASKDITLESRLMDLASSKGLTPLDDLMPEHVHFRKRADYYYFIDKQGRYKVSEGELFDYIQTDAMKFGLEADEPIKKNVAVFIRKPGQYD